MTQKVSQFNDSFQNMKKLFLIYRRRIRFSYHCSLTNFHADREFNTITPKGDYTDELVNTFWLYMNICYFRQLEDLDLAIIVHFINAQIIKTDKKNQSVKEQQNLTKELNAIFSEKYLSQSMLDRQSIINRKNWFDHMSLIIKLDINSSSKFKVISLNNKIKQMRQSRLQMKRILMKQAEIIQDLYFKQEELSQQNEIDSYIQQLQNQYAEVKYKNISISANIKQAINKESQLNSSIINNNHQNIFCVNRPVLYNKINNMKEQLKYIFYQIMILQQKQIAESFSKLIDIIKIGQKSIYTIAFQRGLNLYNQVYEQKQFLALNNLRDISVLNTYFVGWKSKFNYTSQNYLRFNDLVNKDCTKQNDYNMANQHQHRKQISCNTKELFSQMEICHQCRCLYDIKFMEKCKYSSLNFEKPHIMRAYFDEYTEQIIKIGGKQKYKQLLYSKQNRTNNYYRYTLQYDTYSCNRYYCKLCLKGYNNQKKFNVCPFCLGICYCSRCIRNDTIFKLRSIYVRLGGDILKLKEQSQYQKLVVRRCLNSVQTNNVSWNKIKLQTNRGQKLRHIKEQLEKTRLLCHLLKKRQSLKRAIVKKQKDTLKQQLQKLKWKIESNIH